MSTSKTGQTQLRIFPSLPGQRLELLDGNLRQVRTRVEGGEVKAEVGPGIYTVRFLQGGEFGEQFVVAKEGVAEIQVYQSAESGKRFTTAAPVEGTLASHEWQRDPAMRLSRQQPQQIESGGTGDAPLFLFLRCWAKDTRPRTELTIHDANGNFLAALQERGEVSREYSWIALHLATDAGTYRLRRRIGDEEIEQVVFTCQGWQTQVFMLEQAAEDDEPTLQSMSILMARPDRGYDGFSDHPRFAEAALQALAQRAVFDSETTWHMFRQKFDNPMLGLYAALLHLRRDKCDLTLLREVLGNLRQMMGDIPDVLALQWAIAERAGNAAEGVPIQLRYPPMLAESWTHLIGASLHGLAPKLTGLAKKMDGNAQPAAPWLIWPVRVLTDRLDSNVGRSYGLREDLGYPLSASAQKIAPDMAVAYEAKLAGASAKIEFDWDEEALEQVRRFRGHCPDRQYSLGEQWDLLRTAPLHTTERITAMMRGRKLAGLEMRLLAQIDPRLNPMLAALAREDPDLAGLVLRRISPQRLEETLPYTLATTYPELLRVTKKLVEKLVLPSDSMIRRFAKIRGGSEHGYRLLLAFGRLVTGPTMTTTGRPLSALQFLLMYYHPEIATAPIFNHRRPLDQRWPEFLFGRMIGFDSPEDLLRFLRIEACRLLENLAKGGKVQLPTHWEEAVFPPLRAGRDEPLLPPLEVQRNPEPPAASASAG